MERRDGSSPGNERFRRYTFALAGIPYDFGDGSPSSSSSSTSSLPNTSQFIPLPEPRVRGKLDGRLAVPKREKGDIWTAPSDHLISSTRSLRDPSRCNVTSALHKFILMDKQNILPRAEKRSHNTISNFRVKLRGRLDGRLYTPRFQTQFPPSLSQSEWLPRHYFDAFTPPSFQKYVKLCEIFNLDHPKLFRVPSKEENGHQKSLRKNSSEAMFDIGQIPYSEEGSLRGRVHELCDLNQQKREPKESSLSDLDMPSSSNSVANIVNNIFFTSTSEEQYRGRTDARLYTPHDMTCPVQIFTYINGLGGSMPNSPLQDITYNDSLALDGRLFPETTNLYQLKKEELYELSQLRGRVDARLFALHKDAKWGIHSASPYPSSQMRGDETTFKMLEPSFIQELYQKTCSEYVKANEGEKSNERQMTKEFPSSFDGEFVNEFDIKSPDGISDQDYSLRTTFKQNVQGDKAILTEPTQKTPQSPISLPVETSNCPTSHSRKGQNRNIGKIYSI